jgi:uncharacterized protein
VKPVLNNLVSLFLFFILLFAYTKFAGPLPFSVNSVTTQKTTTFDVTGEGKAQASADSATVMAGVNAKGDTQKAVQDQINTTINAVTQSVKALGIDSNDIQTSNYSINPNYEYANGAQKQNGFTASTNLTIKVKDISKVNAVIDGVTAAGATNVNNLGFDTVDKTSAQNEARQKAIADAKKKAADAAGAAGFKLGNLVNYQESENGNQRPIPMLKAVGGSASADSSTNIQPGSNDVDITVTLSYEIRSN